MVDCMLDLISVVLALHVDLFFRFVAVPNLPQGMFDSLKSVLDSLLAGMNTIQDNDDPDGDRNRYRVSDKTCNREYNFGDSQWWHIPPLACPLTEWNLMGNVCDFTIRLV